MIWLTGDKHGQLEPFEENPGYKKLRKGDILLICGDFGFVWDGSDDEKRRQKWLQKRKFEIAFVDGCHENFTMLERYPEEAWNGGKVRRIGSNIVWLQRGESYEIDGKRILAFGGGVSSEREEDTCGITWWREEAPTDEQIDNAIQHIKQANGTFDLILTHEPPLSIKACLDSAPDEGDSIHDVLEQIRTHTNFKKWFFGRYHIDKAIPPSYQAVFDRLIPLE